MRTVEIIGYKRANLGKTEAKRLRSESQVPCVLYGGKEQVHFSSPMILFRDIVYTPEAAFVKLNIEGEEYSAILQDVQFHPVSEVLLHADFLALSDDKQIKMDIPVKFSGTSPGVVQGGKLAIKLRKVLIKALPANMPDNITMDISKLGLGKSLKVSGIEVGDFEILNNPRVTIASMEVPRALKGPEGEDEEEDGDEEAAEGGEETTDAEA